MNGMLRLAFAGIAVALAGVPAAAQNPQWQEMPRMELQGQFAGPLRDTVIQRWRDPRDGTVCYIYLPITVSHTPPPESGYVKYGPNGIGSISCMPGSAFAPAGAGVPAPEPRPEER